MWLSAVAVGSGGNYLWLSVVASFSRKRWNLMVFSVVDGCCIVWWLSVVAVRSGVHLCWCTVVAGC